RADAPPVRPDAHRQAWRAHRLLEHRARPPSPVRRRGRDLPAHPGLARRAHREGAGEGPRSRDGLEGGHPRHPPAERRQGAPTRWRAPVGAPPERAARAPARRVHARDARRRYRPADREGPRPLRPASRHVRSQAAPPPDRPFASSPETPRTRELTTDQVAEYLEATCALVEAELRALGDDASWHFDPREWCANQVVGHVVEAEKRGFAGRIREILEVTQRTAAVPARARPARAARAAPPPAGRGRRRRRIRPRARSRACPSPPPRSRDRRRRRRAAARAAR